MDRFLEKNEIKNMVEEQLMSENIYNGQQFHRTQMKEIREGLMNGVDVSWYADPDFKAEQMAEIRAGLQEGLDVSLYAKTELDEVVMRSARSWLKLKAAEEVYAANYADKQFDSRQRLEILLGLEEGLDVSVYADPEMPFYKMQKIRDRMAEEKNIPLAETVVPKKVTDKIEAQNAEEVVISMEKQEAPFEIWLGNLKAYTEGDIKGEWVSFPQKDEELKEIAARIAGANNDELMIMDISTRDDCAYMTDIIGEWTPPDDLNTVARLIGDEPHPAVQGYADFESISVTELANLLMQEEDIPYFPYEFSGSENPEVMERLSSDEKLGCTMLERDAGMLQVLKAFPMGTSNVLDYIDVEAIGRDLSDSGYYRPTEHGFYDMKNGLPDLEYYTMEEIKEHLAEKERPAEKNREIGKTDTVKNSIRKKPESGKIQKHIPERSVSL